MSDAIPRVTVIIQGDAELALVHQCNVGMYSEYSHQYNKLLNKRFLTPFRDGIWNRRQVSVCDRGVLPTRPRNCRGQALLGHRLGPCATGRGIETQSFSQVCTSHTVNPRKTFLQVCDNPQVQGIATVFEGRVFNPNLLIRHKGSQRIFSSISS